MITILLHLLLMRLVVCEESSSYLLKVLNKIQQERLGLMDEQLGTNYNDISDGESSDYMYENDEDKTSFNTYYHSEYDSNVAEKSKNSNIHVHSKPESTPPTNDLIYIFNDTIYLYKASNSSISLKKPIKQLQMIASADGKPHNGYIPNKMKLMHSSSHKQKNVIDHTDPDNLINIVIAGDEEGNYVAKAPDTSASEGDEEEVEGYYYEYYPLDQIPPEFADTIGMHTRPTKPVKPGMVTKPKKPMMPIKMMKKKAKRPVGPLFKAMAVFVGTAVVFIVSILLLPRVKLVKAKSSKSNVNEITGQYFVQYSELW